VPANSGFSQRRVGAVAVRHGAAEVLYAAITFDRHFGGLFFSSDGGSSWSAYNDGLGKAVAYIHSILPLHSEDEVFLGTGKGLYKGVPGAEEWSLVDGTAGIAITDLGMDGRGNLLYLACSDGIRRMDFVSGEVTKQSLPNEEVEVASVLLGPDQRSIFAGTSEGVFRSQDNGVSWRRVSKGLSGVAVRILEKSGGRILCGTTSGLFYSEDHGDSWSTCSGVFPLEIMDVKANPNSPNEVVAANMLSGYFFTSNDGGRSWEVLELGAALSKISSFAFTSAGELIAGTTTEGVLRLARGLDSGSRYQIVQTSTHRVEDRPSQSDHR
jgi:photosystem II stability/assembly factor-like uncharacterized protein